jgi:SnoaL-like domain
MEIMSDIERLVALEEIKLLKARRDRAVDTKDWETYEALHAPDHYSHNEGFERWNSAAEMIANVKKLMADVVSVHHSHTPQITFESPTKATGIWGMEDNIFWKQGQEDHWLQGFGFYHETYEKRGRKWVFTSRQLKRLHVRTSPGALMGAQRTAASKP